MAMADRKSRSRTALRGGIDAACALPVPRAGLFSYDWQDISLLHVPPITPPCNLIGPVGAWLSFVLFMPAWRGGLPGSAVVPGFRGRSCSSTAKSASGRAALWLGVILLCVAAFMELDAPTWDSDVPPAEHS